MDDITLAFYEERFKSTYLEKGGVAFQDWFSEIMEKRYPGDFQRVRPWGNTGDEKNDGYLTSTRTLFQVYGPNEIRPAVIVAKMEADYCGAVAHWHGHFGRWIFVHNSRDGLSPAVLRKLMELDGRDTSISVRAWGFEELRLMVFELNDHALASLLGPAPSRKALHNLRFSHLRPVLATIAEQELPLEAEIRAVPPGKIAFNRLSRNVTILLNAGMQKADLVQQFFDNWPEPRFGDRVAQAFRRQYEKYRAVHTPPDAIFHELQAFAGGRQRHTADFETAILAVLAYLFEQCEIFERPPEGVAI